VLLFIHRKKVKLEQSKLQRSLLPGQSLFIKPIVEFICIQGCVDSKGFIGRWAGVSSQTFEEQIAKPACVCGWFCSLITYQRLFKGCFDPQA
jgi:hypothetical protein